MKIIILSILIFLTVLGLILVYLRDKSENKKKNRIGLGILILGTICLIYNSISDYIDSEEMSSSMTLLSLQNEKANIMNSTLINLNDSLFKTVFDLRNANDSLIQCITKLNSELISSSKETNNAVKSIKLQNYRKINNKLSIQLQQVLSKYKKHNASIRFMMDSEETNQLANQFKDIFNISGWTVEVSNGMYSPDTKGIRIYSLNNDLLLQSIGKALLNNTDFKFKLNRANNLKEKELVIEVGYR